MACSISSFKVWWVSVWMKVFSTISQSSLYCLAASATFNWRAAPSPLTTNLPAGWLKVTVMAPAGLETVIVSRQDQVALQSGQRLVGVLLKLVFFDHEQSPLVIVASVQI